MFLFAGGKRFLFNYLEVEAFLKELGDDKTGMSNPVLVIADDGETYILKNQNVYNNQVQQWVEWDSMFLQESLVFNIAKYLDLKVPECAIINIDEEFITQAPALQFSHRYTPGYHFASKLVQGVENNLLQGYNTLLQLGKPYVRTSWNNFFKKVKNVDDIPKIIAMDLLTANFDRFGNIGNLLIASTPDREIYPIDHGHCFFGPIWDLDKRRRIMQINANPKTPYLISILQLYVQSNGGQPMSGLGPIFRALDQHLDLSNPDVHSFQDAVLKVESITEDIVDSWFIGIPDVWFVDKANQINTYKMFVLQQKELVGKLINDMANLGAFSSHTGGVLQWKRQRTGTL